MRMLRFEYSFIDSNEAAHYESSSFPYSDLSDTERESLTVGKKLKIIYLPGVSGSSKPAFRVHESTGYVMVICAIFALTYAYLNFRDYLEFKKRRAIADSRHNRKK